MRAVGLSKAFGGRKVLDGVDLELCQGQVVLLQGANGSGKTTLLNILTGNLSPDTGRIELFVNKNSEVFRFPRRWWQRLNPFDHFTPERVAEGGVGRTWQETRLFQSLTLIDNVTVGKPKHPGENPCKSLFFPGKVSNAEKVAKDEASILLHSLGLTDRDQSSADMISLGQTKRVAIARAINAGAKILFLDEPLAGLDAQGVDSVLHLLQSIAKAHQITMVIIEHIWNAYHIKRLADTLWRLEDGKVFVSAESPDDVITNVKPKSVAPANIFHVAGLSGFQDFLSGFRLRAKMMLPSGAVLAFYTLSGTENLGAELVKVEGMIVYRNHRLVIGASRIPNDNDEGLSFKLLEGDIAVLHAPNGWGKSTLFSAMAGIIPISHGSIHLLGKDITRKTSWQRSNEGIYLLRSENNDFPSLTVRELFAISGISSIPEFLAPLKFKPMRLLSGGEKQSVHLGLLRSARKHVYLLDEPFSALDEQRVLDAFRTISELIKHKRTTVMLAMPSAAIRKAPS